MSENGVIRLSDNMVDHQRQELFQIVLKLVLQNSSDIREAVYYCLRFSKQRFKM